MRRSIALVAAIVALALGVVPAGNASGPAGATARCRDGTYSYSHHRRGTCSHHHGVAVWLRRVAP
jgi:Protein of unknown function (DUF3761)